MVILDGKGTADKIKLEIAEKVKVLVERGGKRPHLAAILVGNDGASETYVGHKEKASKVVGFKSSLFRFDTTISQEELLQKIQEINNNDDIDGLIVQLPLPKHIDEQAILQSINPEKDVDGFHPENVGKMLIGLPTFLPATPFGIVKLIEHYNIETKGKNCVVLGRSNIVGKPIANMLSVKGKDCTVTLCHSRTENILEYTKRADIIIAAIGVPEFLKGDMVKDGVVVIDVGITRILDDSKKSGYRLVGDVEWSSVSPKASYITPVPGGVGPMTIISLLSNTLQAAESKS